MDGQNLPNTHTASNRGPFMTTRRLQTSLFMILIVAIFGWLCRNLQLSNQWAFGDHSPVPYSSGQIWNDLAYSWNWTSVGFSGTSGDLYLLTTTHLAGFVPGTDLDAILLVALLPAATISMYFLLKQIYGPSASIIPAALLYGVNPLTVSAFIGGEGGMDAGLLASYAVLPFFLNVLVFPPARTGFARQWFPVLGIGLLIGFVGSNLPELAWTFGPLTILLCLAWFCTGRVDWKRTITRLLVIVIAAAPLLFLSTSNISAVASAPSTYSSYAASSVSFIYQPAGILNLLRGSGSQGSAQWVLGYNGSSWWNQLGISITVLSFLSLLDRTPSARPKHALVLLGALAVISSVSVASLVRTGVLTPLIASSSLFSPLADLADVQSWAVLGISVMLPAGTAVLLRWITQLKFPHRLIQVTHLKSLDRPWSRSGSNRRTMLGTTFLALAVCGMVLVANAPALDGTLGLATTRGNAYVLPPVYGQVERAVGNGSIDLTHYRGLWLPFDEADLPRLHWLTTGLVNPPYELSFITSDSSWIYQLYSAVCTPSVENLTLLLQSWAVRYVFLDYFDAMSLPNGSVSSSGCSISGSSVFTDIEVNTAYLDELRTRLDSATVAYASPGVVVLDTHANPILYVGHGGLVNSSRVASLSVVHAGRNIVSGVEPPNTSAWAVWPDQNLLSTAEVNSQSYLNLTVSASNLSVASQVVSASGARPYNISYSLTETSSDARIRVLWYNETNDLSDGAATAIAYIPGQPLTNPIGPVVRSFSLSASPPISTVAAKIELMAAGLPSVGRSGGSALFGNVSLAPYSVSIDTSKLASVASCSPLPHVINSVTLQLSATSCSGQFVVVLDTAFASDWTIDVSSADGHVSSPPTQHTVVNFMQNGWVVNIAPSDTIKVYYTGSPGRIALVFGTLSYLVLLSALIAVALIWESLVPVSRPLLSWLSKVRNRKQRRR